MSKDQQTSGPEEAVPCPWCGASQNLAELEYDVDSQVSCDDCGRMYLVTAVAPEVRCPKCREPRALTVMEVSENSVTHCEKCHRVFRPGDVPSTTTTNVTLERAA